MKPLTILFVMRSKIYLRNFESVIRALAGAGHRIDITVSADERKVSESVDALSRALEDDHPEIRFGITLERADFWANFAEDIRALRNYLRYLAPEYLAAEALRDRAEKRLPLPGRLLAGLGLFRWPPLRRCIADLAAAVERAIPADRAIVARLTDERPDILLVTPLVDLDSEQIDWVKAARLLGIPSGLCVASWDNLTNKGLIQVAPDRVMVWNQTQKREAIEMHAIAADAVAVTGAQLYDQWFERRPSRDYATFCAQLGLDPDRPTLLYCGSSIFIARNEPEFVARWIAAVRAAGDPAVAGANILIRPHPMHQVPYDELDLSEHARVAIHPRRGGLPVSDDAKADYYDALHHCAAVVGINTSALIEASILNKRCFTVADETTRSTQGGTLHYHYLTEGGPVRQSADLEAHIAALASELSGRGEPKDDIRGFVEAFLRPYGLDRAATPELEKAILEVARARPRAARERDWASLPLRLLCAPVALMLSLSRIRFDWALDLLTRFFRRGLIVIAGLRRRDLVSLVARPMPLDYEGEPISIQATSRQEFVTRSRSVLKEPWTVHWIEHCFQPGELFFDVGANIGGYALLCARVHRRRVQVFAFEPSFATYNALCRNILHNGLARTVTPVPIALDSEGTARLFKYRTVDSGGSRHAMGERAIGIKKQKEVRPQYEQTIFTMSLDEVVVRYTGTAPSHLKIDVDGAELAVLEGAPRTLADPRLKSVMVVLAGPELRPAILSLMSAAGLELLREFDKCNGQGAIDAIFARDAAALATAMAAAPDRPLGFAAADAQGQPRDNEQDEGRNHA